MMSLLKQKLNLMTESVYFAMKTQPLYYLIAFETFFLGL